ncbi:hypothetical protein [Rubrobacter calidifluminis]|uniref:hypothetical protein n=1 Tax=Rubrobacter calidifluminis TaxID=1392640 RepID=UPI0023615E79|nr:hypothetical protein [Rubrobacter calidifluminis]
MSSFSYREWGAIIGVGLVIVGSTLGVGITVVAIILGIVGYLVGRFLEGELDVEEIQERVRGRSNRL